MIFITVFRRMPFYPVLSQLNSVSISTSDFTKTHFNVVLLYTLGLFHRDFPITILFAVLISPVRYMSSQFCILDLIT